ncbi:hypothetical protein [Komagataeibacter swingsii]|uniref:hypothetical protein n=1 Tax=Komagataeibacter swingsii TaxID=215220 RepID=UPI0011B67976|nr:hypothetical protein [Komagataeibacter swingsii]
MTENPCRAWPVQWLRHYLRWKPQAGDGLDVFMNIKEVPGDVFFKRLHKHAAFLKKGSAQKLLFFINDLFPGSLFWPHHFPPPARSRPASRRTAP